MNRSFQPTSQLQRWMFAAAAILTMLATAGGIDGLIAHYGTDAPHASTPFGTVNFGDPVMQ